MGKAQTSCPICNSPHLLPQGVSVTGQALVACSDCRHITFAELPDDDELAQHYGKEYTAAVSQEEIQEQNRSYYAHHAAEPAGLVSSRGAPRILLDVGSSIPILCQEALRAGFDRAIAIEPSETARSWAASTGVEVISPEELASTLDGSLIGVIRYSHVLEHLPDPVAVLRSNARFLAGNGFVYITQPNFPVTAPVNNSVLVKDSVWPEHLHFFNMRSVEIMLTRAGLHPFELWSFQNERAVEADHAGLLDPGFMQVLPEALRLIHPQGADPLGVFPHFLGENSVIYAHLTR